MGIKNLKGISFIFESSRASSIPKEGDVKPRTKSKALTFANLHKPFASFRNHDRISPFRHQQDPFLRDMVGRDESLNLREVARFTHDELEPRFPRPD